MLVLLFSEENNKAFLSDKTANFCFADGKDTLSQGRVAPCDNDRMLNKLKPS
jgi:hypothetical protein